MLRRYMVICGLFEGSPVPSLAEVLRQGSPAPRSRARVRVDSGRVQSHIHGAFSPPPGADTKSCPRESTRGHSWKSVAEDVGIGRLQVNVDHEGSKKQRRDGKNNLN